MGETQLPELVPLPSLQTQRAYEVLAQAFDHYPLIEYVFPDYDHRPRAWSWWLGYTVRYCLRHGEVYTTPRLEAVAAWLPPTETHITYRRHIEAGALQMPLRIGLRAFRRAMGYGLLVEEAQKHHVTGPFYYLWTLAVAPVSQGKGIVSFWTDERRSLPMSLSNCYSCNTGSCS
ncbi:MAG: hypothetical protein ACUVWR_18820 [Anaerolineae bacterium]